MHLSNSDSLASKSYFHCSFALWSCFPSIKRGCCKGGNGTRLVMSLNGGYCRSSSSNYPHFTDEETSSGEVSRLPKVPLRAVDEAVIGACLHLFSGERRKNAIWMLNRLFGVSRACLGVCRRSRGCWCGGRRFPLSLMWPTPTSSPWTSACCGIP